MRARSERDYLVEQMRKDIDAQADTWKSMDARILALIVLDSALFSFTIALIGFDKMPNISSLPPISASTVADVTPSVLLVVTTLLITIYSLTLLAAAYWGQTFKRPASFELNKSTPLEALQERWLAEGRQAFDANSEMLATRQVHTLRALYLLGGQCMLVAYPVVVQVLGSPAAPGALGRSIVDLGVIVLACLLVYMSPRVKPFV
jgi:hypothetical protein